MKLKTTTTIKLVDQAGFYVFCLYKHHLRRNGSKDRYFAGAADAEKGILYQFHMQDSEQLFSELERLAEKLVKEQPDGLTMPVAKQYAANLLSKYLDDEK